MTRWDEHPRETPSVPCDNEFSKSILLAHQENNSELIRLRVDYEKNNTKFHGTT